MLSCNRCSLLSINCFLSLTKVKNKYLSYDKYWIFDKLVGSKRINNHHGFSGIKYFTVMGQKIKENYIKLSIGKKRHIKIELS